MELIIGSQVGFNNETQLLGSVKEAIENNANTFMIYTGGHSSTIRGKINPLLTKEAHDLMIENNINKDNIIVHAPFLLNPANDLDSRKYNFYIAFLKQEITRLQELGLKNLVFHPGSSVTLSREKAIENLIFAINKILEVNTNINIMIEFMSGKGSEIGSSIEDIKAITDGVNENIYVCLDTCHLNDSGVDLNKFDEFLDEFDKNIGIDKIKCMHINDSYNEVGAKKDRHANIGYGKIGFDTLINVIYNPRLKNIPKILETPFLYKNNMSSYKIEIDMIRNKKFIDFINL